MGVQNGPTNVAPAGIATSLPFVALIAALLGACADPTSLPRTLGVGDAGTGGTDQQVVDVSLAPTGCAGYEVHGPYDVGVTTLDLDGMPVEVWYPANPGAADGHLRVAYDIREWLPEEDRTKLPDEDTPLVPTDAVRDLPASTNGPFPIVLFSHGMGGYRLQSSFLMTHLASWGFVVAAPDHPERGLAIMMETGTPTGDNAPATLRATYDLLAAEQTRAGGLLQGRIDVSRVAVTGHSAGGAAVLDVAADPNLPIAAWATFASGGYTSSDRPDIPSLMMGGTIDGIVPANILQPTFELQAPDKRFVAVEAMGHFGFTDICAIGSDQGGLLQIALDHGIDVPPLLLALGNDGCQAGGLPPEQGWPIIAHYTTAHLFDAFGIDAEAAGLRDESAACFGSNIATYLHD